MQEQFVSVHDTFPGSGCGGFSNQTTSAIGMSRWRRSFLSLSAVLLLAGGLAGCVSLPYRTMPITDSQRTLRLRPGEEQFVRGRPIPVLDRTIGWIWPESLLGKLILWDHRVDSHYISEETEQALREYLEYNNLRHTKVRLNSWNVGDEWRRTLRNREVEPWFRYSLGIIAAIQYTIFPGRIFGGDNYNPYSNTINLYSDLPAIALHEGGHAKDFGRRRFKGLHAFIYTLPFGSLYHEAVATGDVLAYLQTYGTPQQIRQAYRILYPAYGTYLGDAITTFAPDETVALVINGTVIISTHIVGRVHGGRAARVRAGAEQ